MPKKNKPILFVSCVEASADLYTAALLAHPYFKKFELVGLGGKKLIQSGLRLIDDMTAESTIGFLEPLLKLPYFLKRLRLVKKALKESNAEALLVTDGQGFHLPLIQYAQELRIPVIYFISPQEWQWGSKAAGQKIVKLCDLMIDIYPKATEFYRNLGANAQYIGHPLLDLVKTSSQSKSQNLITIFPGSRRQEVTKLLPLFLDSVKPFAKDFKIAVSCSHPKFQKYIQTQLKIHKIRAQIFTDKQYEWMNKSKVVLTASGTITLELAILKKPFIAAYRFGALSYFLAKLILGKRAPKFIAWPNLMAGKMITPEFLQNQATVSNIQNQINKLTNEPKTYQKVQKNLSLISKKLGGRGAVAKGQNILIDFLKNL
jgi:lipid-A-disaccharide synthase